jgi:hypothetical protein
MGTTHKTSISQEKQKTDFKETSLFIANFCLSCHYDVHILNTWEWWQYCLTWGYELCTVPDLLKVCNLFFWGGGGGGVDIIVEWQQHDGCLKSSLVFGVTVS